MNFYQGRNHHVKPVQPMVGAGSKFSSERMRQIYSYIKFINKALGIKLSSYWIKKELLKSEYNSILESCTSGKESGGDRDDIALTEILRQPEFKMKFKEKIDFKMSQEKGFICLRR